MRYELIVVGASWGALGRLLEGLSDELDVPIVITQHRSPEGIERGLEEVLQHRVDRPVVQVDDKDAVEPGRIYLAPPDYHLLIDRGAFALSTEDPVSYARPSIDVLFESAADAYGRGTIGIILTGANADGAEGLAAIKRAGGVAIVQDPETAARRARPDAALARTAADVVLPVEEIPAFLYGLCCAPAEGRAHGVPGAGR